MEGFRETKRDGLDRNQKREWLFSDSLLCFAHKLYERQFDRLECACRGLRVGGNSPGGRGT